MLTRLAREILVWPRDYNRLRGVFYLVPTSFGMATTCLYRTAAAVCHQLRFARKVHCTELSLAGHNKWSKIKRKKAVADMERNKHTTKLISQLITAVRLGGADPEINIALSGLLSQAKSAGIPKTTVESAILTATSKQAAAETAAPVLYEGRGPSGYLLLVEALTENRNRTRPEIRRILEKNG